jgi:twinkle protein
MPKITSSKGIFEIEIPNTPPNSEGEVYMVCPVCVDSRRESHQKEKKMSVNVRKKPTPWRCHHCGEGGYLLTDDHNSNAKIKPLTQNYNFSKISDPLAKWFWEKRKISITTLNHFEISLSEESLRQNRVPEDQDHLRGEYVTRKCINFKYFWKNNLINIKFRDQYKNFKLISGASKIPYNLDSIKNSKVAVITEGEPDTLAYHEAGVPYTISVPNGATITEKERKIYEETGKLEILSNINLDYLDPVIDDLDHIEIFYIATDDDAPGIKLREELARRLGYERCKYIKFGLFTNKEGKPINDPNEMLVEHGKEALASTLDSAISFPIANVTTADQYLDLILNNYKNEKAHGLSTGYKSLDPYFNWMRGWPYVFNGFPNMGKTSFALNLAAISAVMYGWKWGIYCPENYPVEDVIEILCMILIGKTIEYGFDKRISENEIENVVKEFIYDHFFFVDNEDGFTPKDLRAIKKQLIKQKGIVGFLTDPWTSLIHEVAKHGGEDQYLNFELNNEVRLTTKYNLVNIICHHPVTPKDKGKLKVPTVWQLTGGKFWWIKMYSAISVHQEDFDEWNNNMVGIHIQKNKNKQRAGETTNESLYPIFRYDKLSRRFYEPVDPDAKPKKFNMFPFDTYLDAKQKSLFEGF